jgi:hypothetical protein
MKKSAWQVMAALLFLVALAVLMSLSWGWEGRSRADVSRETLYARQAEARAARWTLQMALKMKELEGRLAGMDPSSEEYSQTSENVKELKNLIASKVPSVVAGRDPDGNAILQPYDAVIAQLVATSNSATGKMTEAQRALGMPYEATLFSIQVDYLDEGWWAPEISSGIRFTKQQATVEIRNAPDLKKVALSMLWLPPGTGPGSGTVYVNGVRMGEFAVTEAAPTKYVFDKPPGSPATLKIRIVNEKTIVPSEVVGSSDNREIGVAVQRVWQE